MVGIVFPSLHADYWKPIPAGSMLEGAQIKADFGCLLEGEVSIRIQMLRIKNVTRRGSSFSVNQKLAITLNSDSTMNDLGI